MTYAIFKVYDYKGGELNHDVNLSKEVLIYELADVFENKFEEDKEELEKDLEKIKEFINKCIVDEDFFSTYAGGGGWCGEIFEVNGDIMKQVNFTSFLEEIAQYIFDNWFDE